MGDGDTAPYAASRLKLTQAATAAAPAAMNNATVVPFDGNAVKISATIAAPIDWPNNRAVACIPLAPPVLTGGAEVMIARLFGVLKKPKPRPHTVIRQTISSVVG
jgi:hypothetical protein